MKTVIIIGAGVGGIATAARLAQKGYDVTVLEKNDRPGGRASLIQEQGYTFDTGPSLFLMPETYAATYTDLGERMEDHLDLARIDPTYRVHFHDGSSIELTGDLLHMREQLEAIEPGSFEAYARFVAEGYRHYTLSIDRFVGRNFYNLLEFFSPANLPMMFQLKALQKHYADVSGYFQSPRLRAALSFQNMYLGLSPFDAPATFTLLQYTELAEGVWYPRGGMYSIVTSLTGIAEGLGVRFQYNTPVTRIDVDGQRATGVTLEGGEQLKADLVIANADLPWVYANLLPDDGTAAKLDRKKFTSATFMFYWGLKGERTDKLMHHNVFLSDDRYRESFHQIFDEHLLPAEPSFYIHAPVRTVPSFAPADGDALMVLVPTGHMDEAHAERQDWPALQQRARRDVLKRLARLGLDDIEERIVFESTFTPPDYLRIWNLAKGAAFGLSHNFSQIGYLRPHNRHARYGNLYFVGASTHPGTGVPIVLLSARLTTERILKEQ
ncbi:MAG: phytoene desaturase [Chloroflexi bacterium]|nr:phytoene desaturase [Chloroflexota bacterium]MBU1751541.1 phytoene desaturase [Chloroflexota bacterium]MBU1879859.1 phytoene desaturase [Chloroflexota bacterium]